MASPRKFDIYLRPGKGKSDLEWSYFDSEDPDHWNPVTPTSPNLLLKEKDEVNWIATGEITDIEIDLPPNPKVFDEIKDNKGKKPKSKGKEKMVSKAVDKYHIKVTISGSRHVEVDPKGTGDYPVQ